MDLALHETGSGGSLEFSGGDITSTNSVYNLIYIALFGGNVGQTTIESVSVSSSNYQRSDWWGNSVLFNSRPNNQYVSFFEKTINEVTLNSGGRSRLEAAAKKDLKSIEDIASVNVSVIVTGNDSFHMYIDVQEKSSLESQLFKLIWDSTKIEFIKDQIVS